MPNLADGAIKAAIKERLAGETGGGHVISIEKPRSAEKKFGFIEMDSEESADILLKTGGLYFRGTFFRAERSKPPQMMMGAPSANLDRPPNDRPQTDRQAPQNDRPHNHVHHQSMMGSSFDRSRHVRSSSPQHKGQQQQHNLEQQGNTNDHHVPTTPNLTHTIQTNGVPRRSS